MGKENIAHYKYTLKFNYFVCISLFSKFMLNFNQMIIINLTDDQGKALPEIHLKISETS